MASSPCSSIGRLICGSILSSRVCVHHCHTPTPNPNLHILCCGIHIVLWMISIFHLEQLCGNGHSDSFTAVVWYLSAFRAAGCLPSLARRGMWDCDWAAILTCSVHLKARQALTGQWSFGSERSHQVVEPQTTGHQTMSSTVVQFRIHTNPG